MLGLLARTRIIKSRSTSPDTPQKKSYYKKGNWLAPTSKIAITNYYIKKSSIYSLNRKGVSYALYRPKRRTLFFISVQKHRQKLEMLHAFPLNLLFIPICVYMWIS